MNKIKIIVMFMIISCLIIPSSILINQENNQEDNQIPSYIFAITRNTWISNGVDINASNSANWENGSVTSNKILVFTSASVVNCNYDLTTTVKGIYSTSDYTGIFIQNKSFIVNGNIRWEGGTLQSDNISALPIHTLTFNGDIFLVHNAIMENLAFNIIFTSSYTEYIQYYDISYSGYPINYVSVLNNLTIESGNTLHMIIGNGITWFGMGSMNTYIQTGATLILDSSQTNMNYPFIWYPGYNSSGWNHSWSNYGIVTSITNTSNYSVYPFIFWSENAVSFDYDISFGNIDSDIYLYNGNSNVITATLISNAYLINTSLSQDFILDCGIYNLTTQYLNSSAGSFINLSLETDITLLSDVYISGWLTYYNNSDIILNGYNIIMTYPSQIRHMFPVNLLNIPDDDAELGKEYSYQPSFDQSIYTITLVNNTPDWVILYNNTIIGIPQYEDLGIYIVRLTVINDAGYITYINYTISVISPTPDITTSMIMYFIFLIILTNFVLIGSNKYPILLILSLILTIVVAVPSIIAFEGYYFIAFGLILVNAILSTIGLLNLEREEND